MRAVMSESTREVSSKFPALTHGEPGARGIVFARRELRREFGMDAPNGSVTRTDHQARLLLLYTDGEQAAELRARKVEEYRARFANPYVAAERGYIDGVVEPAQTRPKLIAALRLLENKRDTNPRRKHGNIPL